MGNRKNKFSSNIRGGAPSGYAGLYFIAILTGVAMMYFSDTTEHDDLFLLNLLGWFMFIFGLAKLVPELRPLMDKYFPLPGVKSSNESSMFGVVKNTFAALMVLSIVVLVLQVFTIRNTFGGAKVAMLSALAAVPVWLIMLFVIGKLLPGIYSDGDRRFKIAFRALIFFTSIGATSVPFINNQFADVHVEYKSYRVANTYTTSGKHNDVYHINIHTTGGEKESFIVKEPLFREATKRGSVTLCTRKGYFGYLIIQK